MEVVSVLVSGYAWNRAAGRTPKCNARKLGVVLVGRVTRDGRVVFCLGPMKMMIHLPVPVAPRPGHRRFTVVPVKGEDFLTVSQTHSDAPSLQVVQAGTN